jgi:hypothetical protein
MGQGIALRHAHRARFAATIIDVDQSGHAAQATEIGRRGCFLTDPSMLAHLIEIESYLALNEKEEAPLDLKSVFAGLEGGGMRGVQAYRPVS